MIRVKHPNGREVTFPDKLRPEICLQLCGGGYSAKQTKAAMLLDATLEEERRATYKGFVITLE